MQVFENLKSFKLNMIYAQNILTAVPSPRMQSPLKSAFSSSSTKIK